MYIDLAEQCGKSVISVKFVCGVAIVGVIRLATDFFSILLQCYHRLLHFIDVVRVWLTTGYKVRSLLNQL